RHRPPATRSTSASEPDRPTEYHSPQRCTRQWSRRIAGATSTPTGWPGLVSGAQPRRPRRWILPPPASGRPACLHHTDRCTPHRPPANAGSSAERVYLDKVTPETAGLSSARTERAWLYLSIETLSGVSQYSGLLIQAAR